MPTPDASATPARVYFPCLHAGLLPPPLAGAAVYFDPGLAPADPGQGEGPYFRPASLPLAQAELAAVLAQYEALEREVRTPRELDAFFASRFEDVFPETRSGIEDALRDGRISEGRDVNLCILSAIEAARLAIGSGLVVYYTSWW